VRLAEQAPGLPPVETKPDKPKLVDNLLHLPKSDPTHPVSYSERRYPANERMNAARQLRDCFAAKAPGRMSMCLYDARAPAVVRCLRRPHRLEGRCYWPSPGIIRID
jgi:hypothetical protein